LDPYSIESVEKLLKKYKKNIKIVKGNSNLVLKEINIDNFDYVFLDGGHKYETVLEDLKLLTRVIKNSGTILCDDYNLTYAPGVKKAIDEYVLLNNFNLKILCSRFAEITQHTS
jgi:precorrin-6B methylase 2